ncbi:DNA repair exonuclease [Clostridium sp.]|uniref:metallophosphoesterase family protein n=1 Tax=Clostridium sp. TaxID=1506 RepID=UPI00262FC1E2
MKKVKILHCSDIHFDTPFKELPKEISAMRRAELRESFSKIINKGIDKEVDLVLLAGDLFDNDTIEKSTLTFIRNQMDKLEKHNIRVFISAGNHDPYNKKSFYNMINFGKNVYIFKDEIERIEIPELNTVIYGASFKEKYMRESKLKHFNTKEEDKYLIKIMVMHGDLGNNETGEYNPLLFKEIEASKIDYIALGHIHKFSGIKRIGKTYYAYSGCPEGRGFDEEGDKGIILGDISLGAVDLDFIKINKREYFVKEIDISNCGTNEEIIDKILNTISKESREKNLFKIILKGDIEESFKIDSDLIENLIREEFFYCKIVNSTRMKIDIDEMSNEYSIKGIFCSLIKDSLESNEENEEILDIAFRIGMESILDGEVNLNDN